jgi:hypothetical protein
MAVHLMGSRRSKSINMSYKVSFVSLNKNRSYLRISFSREVKAGSRSNTFLTFASS